MEFVYKKAEIKDMELLLETRACLKIAFRQMCVTICGRFGPNEGGVVGYVDRMRAKSPAKWGVHMVGMNFQTRSRIEVLRAANKLDDTVDMEAVRNYSRCYYQRH